MDIHDEDAYDRRNFKEAERNLVDRARRPTWKVIDWPSFQFNRTDLERIEIKNLNLCALSKDEDEPDEEECILTRGLWAQFSERRKTIENVHQRLNTRRERQPVAARGKWGLCIWRAVPNRRPNSISETWWVPGGEASDRLPSTGWLRSFPFLFPCASSSLALLSWLPPSPLLHANTRICMRATLVQLQSRLLFYRLLHSAYLLVHCSPFRLPLPPRYSTHLTCCCCCSLVYPRARPCSRPTSTSATKTPAANRSTARSLRR